MQHFSPANGHGKVIFAHLLAASLLGFMASTVVATRHYLRKKSTAKRDPNIIPRLDRTESGRVGRLERFSHYVARQMGFADPSDCPQLCKSAYDYLKRSPGCEDNIYEFLADEPEANSLYVKLIEELERCILSYFGFHWNQASVIISQVGSSFSHLD
uniref:Uncharacterized protein LOC105129489 isoform X2 n=1 Tax=Rhizophora mucronata TaxID=61149 RepID=A0A2P2KMK4_RHIMU